MTPSMKNDGIPGRSSLKYGIPDQTLKKSMKFQIKL